MAEEPNVKKQKLDESDETETEGKNYSMVSPGLPERTYLNVRLYK